MSGAQRLAGAVAELAKRERRKRHKASLLEFVKDYWSILEPGRPFVEGWALKSVCEHLEAVSRGEITRLLINVPPGFMKPVHIDEPIATDRGFVRLGDVRVGDKVLTHRGRYRAVTAVHEQGDLPVMRVTSWSGRSVLSAPDHPFLTPRGWVAASDLTATDYVALPRVDSIPCVSPMAAEEARLLGYLVGDGCISQRSLAFINMDQETLDDFIACAKACGFHAYATKHPNGKVQATKIVLKSSESRWKKKDVEPPVLQWLRTHGLYRSNSYTKRIPVAVMTGGQVAIENFLGAYWSCDGNVTVRHAGNKTTMVATAVTVSEELAGDLQRAFMLLNVQMRVRPQSREMESTKQAGGTYHYYQVQTTEHNEVAKLATLPMVKRKRDLARRAFFDRFEPNLYADAVRSVEPAGVGACRCLTVDEDSSFTVNGLIVHNSLLVNVFWPAWEWGPMSMEHLRYISFSYAAHLTERDNRKLLTLVQSPQYREDYPKASNLTKAGETLVQNDKMGFKFATSVGGVGTGERADRLLCDDPHNVAEGESDAVRTSTVRWFREAMSNRLNDIETGVIVVIMQRVHEADVSGTIIDEGLGYTHLMIPMEYDSARRCETSIGWRDPRSVDGDLAWPARFSKEACAILRRDVTEYGWASQYQQTPVPRGGGIFRDEWWQRFDLLGPNGRAFPPMEFTVASLDPAYTDKQANDFSALTVWGMFRLLTGAPALMLLYGWQKRLILHSPETPRKPGESKREYEERCKPTWGLVEWVGHTCERYKVDKLLIEAKASGHSVAQEIRRLYAGNSWGCELVNPKALDKVARAHAVTHLLTDGIVYVPRVRGNPEALRWVQDYLLHMGAFPRGRHDDWADSTTQALNWLRQSGILIRREEQRTAEAEEREYRKPDAPLYPV